MVEASSNVIAAHGQFCVGKDTLCDYLVTKLNKGKKKGPWKRTAFANAVKDVFCSAFGYDRKFVEEWKRKEEKPDNFLVPVRNALQKIGDGFREIKQDIWIDIALRDQENIIISDGRYLNEAKKVREKGGINILIYRAGFINNDPNPSEATLKPIVEYCRDTIPDGKIYHSTLVRYPDGLENYDLFIRNDGDVAAFYKKVDKYIVPYVLEKLN
jgi:hypothetical protein